MTKAVENTQHIKSEKSVAGNIKNFFVQNYFIILALVVPLILMVTAFGIMEVSPFGDKQILVTDLWHQYFPFLVDFQDKLKNGESLFWTWSVGSGVNYFALMSYYLASPLNFLSAFVPGDWLREFLMFSVAVKIACAGMFTAIFLRSIFKKNDFSLVVFGCCFSFCAFFMGYYWNTIWLDTVCIVPLVALGAVKLFTENRFRLYVVTLSLSLLTNYYIGLFACIFVLLAFIAYSIICWNGIKSFFIKLIQTGIFSVIAIGITAFFLLPAYFGLQNTYATGSTFPTAFAINIGSSNDLAGVLDAMKKILSNYLTFIEPATKEADALPNIACGTASIVFGILFFTSKKIPAKEKIVNFCIIVFMLISCVIRQLDYIWHGFHFTNMIPYRFSYLVSFLIVVMAYRAYMLIDNSSLWDVILTALFTALIILVSINIQETYAVVGTAVIALILIAMLTLYSKRIIPKIVLAIVVSIVIIAESGATAYIGVKTTTVTGTYDYPRGEETTEQLINYMDSLEENTPELWRAETTTTQTLNDGALNHYNGLSMFNSMANVNMTRFFENFGMMGWKSGNRYTYAESSPVTNMFMNLKYLISRDGNYHNTYDLQEAYIAGNEKLLKNTHYIPMGFMVKSGLTKWEENDNEDQFNPFDKQNEFFKMATGINENVYTQLEVVSQGHTDYSLFNVNKVGYGNYSYNCTNTTVTPQVKWNYEASQDGIYCFYADIDGGDDVTIMINDVAQPQTYGMGRSYIACLGECKQGDKISVFASLPQGQAGSAKVYVNMLNKDIFEQGYEIVSKNVMTTTKLTGSSMEGTIEVTEDNNLLYTSIPYEKGWSAEVDGKKAEITPIGNSLVALELSKGKHEIKLTYYPQGFWAGFAVSLICVLVFAGLCVYFYIIKKSKAVTVTAENQEETEKEIETVIEEAEKEPENEEEKTT